MKSNTSAITPRIFVLHLSRRRSRNLLPEDKHLPPCHESLTGTRRCRIRSPQRSARRPAGDSTVNRSRRFDATRRSANCAPCGQRRAIRPVLPRCVTSAPAPHHLSLPGWCDSVHRNGCKPLSRDREPTRGRGCSGLARRFVCGFTASAMAAVRECPL